MRKFKTVDFSKDENAIEIIDQSLLPGEFKIIKLRTQEDITDAIKTLKVRGAPAIGVTAAMGYYLAAGEVADELESMNLFCYDDEIREGIKAEKKETAESEKPYKSYDFEGKSDHREETIAKEKNLRWLIYFDRLKKKKEYLASSRPTAVNLFWALDRMERAALNYKKVFLDDSIERFKECLKREAEAIRDEDGDVCRKIGDHGSKLIKPDSGILTYCNAGALATTAYGTATAPIYRAFENGMKDIRVFSCETRPLLQGARLTAFELSEAGIKTCLICDNMISALMRRGSVDLVLVGCDRVAKNGDTANKIGTSQLAIVARQYGIPLYVCAPFSTIDFSINSGDDIVIEECSPLEVTEMWYKQRMAPEDIDVFNPAFDVTDNEFITGFITEKGILKPPFK